MKSTKTEQKPTKIDFSKIANAILFPFNSEFQLTDIAQITEFINFFKVHKTSCTMFSLENISKETANIVAQILRANSKIAWITFDNVTSDVIKDLFANESFQFVVTIEIRNLKDEAIKELFKQIQNLKNLKGIAINKCQMPTVNSVLQELPKCNQISTFRAFELPGEINQEQFVMGINQAKNIKSIYFLTKPESETVKKFRSDITVYQRVEQNYVVIRPANVTNSEPLKQNVGTAKSVATKPDPQHFPRSNEDEIALLKSKNEFLTKENAFLKQEVNTISQHMLLLLSKLAAPKNINSQLPVSSQPFSSLPTNVPPAFPPPMPNHSTYATLPLNKPTFFQPAGNNTGPRPINNLSTLTHSAREKPMMTISESPARQLHSTFNSSNPLPPGVLAQLNQQRPPLLTNGQHKNGPTPGVVTKNASQKTKNAQLIDLSPENEPPLKRTKTDSLTSSLSSSVSPGTSLLSENEKNLMSQLLSPKKTT